MSGEVIVYIAGPMTGLPEKNISAFMEAEERLLAVGFGVRNPARVDEQFPRVDGEERNWVWYMRKCLPWVCEAHGIALLPNWNRSLGAKAEYDIARMLQMPAASVDAWVLGFKRLQKEVLRGDYK